MNLDQLQKILLNKDLKYWEEALKNIENPSAEYLGNLFSSYFQNDDITYFPFAKKVWLYFSSEDDKETLLWVWVEDVYRVDKQYAEFIIDLLLSIENKNDFESLSEYFFDLLGLYYKPKLLIDNTQLIVIQNFLKNFLQHPDLIICTSAYLFSYQEQLVDKFPQELLEKFSTFSEKMQESFIHLIFRSPMPDIHKQWVRKSIKNIFIAVSERIQTSFIIHILENIEDFNDLNDSILHFLNAQPSKFLQESILLYLLPAEIATKPDLQRYISYFLDNSNLTIVLMILDNLPQYFNYWPEQLQNKVVSLIKSPEFKIRLAIIKLISPDWINEELLAIGLNDQSVEVQETAILTCITVFQHLKDELKILIENLINPSNAKWKDYYALLIGYNFDYKNFYTECLTLLNGNHKAAVNKCVYALTLRWNDLPKELRKILTNNINNWNESIYQGLQTFSGVLDKEGTEILEYLSERETFISMNDLTFKEEG